MLFYCLRSREQLESFVFNKDKKKRKKRKKRALDQVIKMLSNRLPEAAERVQRSITSLHAYHTQLLENNQQQCVLLERLHALHRTSASAASSLAAVEGGLSAVVTSNTNEDSPSANPHLHPLLQRFSVDDCFFPSVKLMCRKLDRCAASLAATRRHLHTIDNATKQATSRIAELEAQYTQSMHDLVGSIRDPTATEVGRQIAVLEAQHATLLTQTTALCVDKEKEVSALEQGIVSLFVRTQQEVRSIHTGEASAMHLRGKIAEELRCVLQLHQDVAVKSSLLQHLHQHRRSS